MAGRLVDFALGSDTGGSVRVPAAFCGLYGLRPTHGRISFGGVLPQAPSYDTVGWFARDAEVFARVGAVLLERGPTKALPARLVLAEDAFEAADETVRDALRPVIDIVASLIGDFATERLASTSLADWSAQQQVLQGREAWEAARDWIDRVNPRFSFEVTERYIGGSAFTDAEVEAANSAREAVVRRMDAVLADDAVVCIPTVPAPAPPLGERRSSRRGLRSRIAMLTCIAGTTGGPQINLPLAEVGGLPIGLSLIGARGSDEMLIALAFRVAVHGGERG